MRYSARFLILSFLMALAPGAFAQSINTGLSGIDIAIEGCMFDIEATKNLSIQSFDIQIENILNPFLLAEFEVWTTVDGGSYLSREEDPLAWRRIAIGDCVPQMDQGLWSPLNLNLNELVVVGQSRGFYVVRPEQGTFSRLLAHSSAIQNVPYVTNADLSVKAGFDCHYFDRFSGPAMASINVHYTVEPIVSDNIRLHRILSPVIDPTTCAPSGSSESLSIEILNLGTNNISSGTVLPVSYQLDGGPIVMDFAVTGTTLTKNDSLIFTFSQPLDLSLLGQHNVVVNVAWPLDQDSSDDSLSQTFSSGGTLRVTEFPWFETFDSLNPANVIVPPSGWSQDSMDSMGPDSEWQFTNVGGSGTRPNQDHTTGVGGDGSYAFSDDEHAHAAVILRSPCIDLTNISHPELRFWMFSKNVNVSPNFMSVDVLEIQSGAVTVDVFGPVGHLSNNSWLEQVVDLSAFAGNVIQLVFRASTDHLGSTQTGHDIAIDDVSIHNAIPTFGQAPQPDFAVLDLNQSRNINNELVLSDYNGPYFTSVQANSQLLIEFSGEPQMAVLLLGGPLSPVAATFPVIGNLDIGGAVNPLTGIPSGVVVLADGNLPSGLNPFFNTGPDGEGMFGVTVPNIPPGILTTFQCAVHTTGANGSYIALSNAVEVEID